MIDLGLNNLSGIPRLAVINSTQRMTARPVIVIKLPEPLRRNWERMATMTDSMLSTMEQARSLDEEWLKGHQWNGAELARLQTIGVGIQPVVFHKIKPQSYYLATSNPLPITNSTGPVSVTTTAEDDK
jgi:hypothetical protein